MGCCLVDRHHVISSSTGRTGQRRRDVGCLVLFQLFWNHFLILSIPQIRDVRWGYSKE